MRSYFIRNAFVFTLGCLTLSLAEATPPRPGFFCGYKDHFQISDKSHPNIYIAKYNADDELIFNYMGPRSFQIRDTKDCKPGYAHVTLLYDGYPGWCVLDIKDGPYMMHPRITASCNGMRYVDMSYGGFGSYEYTLHFD